MKKVRKFAKGGDTEGKNPNISGDVRQRAAFFAALADKSRDQEEFARSVREAQQAEAEASDRAKLPPPSPAPRSASSSSSPPRSTPSGGAPASRSTPQAYSSDDFDPDRAPAEAAASLNARTRNMGVEEPKPTRTPTRALPVSSFEEENNARVARNKAEKQEREGLKSLARGIERTDKDLEEAKAKPNPALRSAMGERQARQMEEKGSIYSKDYGKPKAERDAIEAGERSDRREQARQAAEERDRRDSERKRGIRRAEVEGNVERDEANQGAARRKQEEEAKRKEAERVRAEERRQMAGESARDREDMDTGIAKSKSRSEAGAKRKQEEEAKAKPNPALRSAMGERQAKQMEQKGPIFSRDFGKPKAERDAIKAGERSDQREQARQAAEERDRRRRERIRQAAEERDRRRRNTAPGSVQGASFKSGGMVSSASKRADGIASKGKTRGRIY